ncbi:hypothetical protein [Streptomyces goshikiensis]|uniref:hypothetical protein n=1 Tax=Streptomyces goshikiensis TaxID=1942 RepID=UPI0037157E13
MTSETKPGHVCKPGVSLYYCPASDRTESDCHGGFDVCCDRPDLHLPVTDDDPTLTVLMQAARAKGLRLEVIDTEESTCCVCGGGPVAYRNFRDQPFCAHCANCQCTQNPCVRTGVNDPAVSAEAAGYCPDCGRGDAGPTADEYEQQRQRAEQAEDRLKQMRKACDAMAFKADDLAREAATTKSHALLHLATGYGEAARHIAAAPFRSQSKETPDA